MDDNFRMTPAALAALLKGDLENAIIASTPGGIEAQEAQGQRDFVANTTLPTKCNGCTRGQLEQMGIVFGDKHDDLFVEVRLPQGWLKRPTGHSMWTDLIDSRGRKRASIFYKAAFYDRDAFISINRRFHAASEPVDGWDNQTDSSLYHGCVKDWNEDILWKTEPIEPKPSWDDNAAYRAWIDKRDALEREAIDWLEKNYPDNADPLAYWD